MSESQNHKTESSNSSGFNDKKLTLSTYIDLIYKRKIFFILTMGLAIVGTLLGHQSMPTTYKSTSTLFIQTIEQKSAAEYLLDHRLGQSSITDKLDSYMSYLKSDSYFMTLAEKLKFHEEFSELVLSTPEPANLLSFDFWKKKLFPDEDKTAEMAKHKMLIPIDSIVAFLKNSVQYTENSTQFIYITATTLDARTSQIVAQVAAQEFTNLTNKHGIEEIEEIEKYVMDKLEESRKTLQSSERELVEFKKQHSIISSDLASTGLADRLSQIELQIQTNRIEMEENAKLEKFYLAAKSRNLDNLISSGSKNFNGDQASLLLQDKLSELNNQKTVLVAQGFDANSWRVQELDKEIDDTTKQLKQIVGDLPQSAIAGRISPFEAEQKLKELKQKVKGYEAKFETLNKTRASIQKQVEGMPTLQQKQITLENKVKLEYEVFTKLKNKLEELQIEKISQKKDIRVDQMATLPGPTPKGSLLFKLLFTCLISLFLGALIVLGIETLDPSIRRRSDLLDCGLEYLGEIPIYQKPNTHKKRTDYRFGEPEDLICQLKPDSLEAMYFKFIRAKLESIKYKHKKSCQVVTITSSNAGEGKSFISSNISVSLSQLRRKTLIIDCDFRKPSIANYFGLDLQKGLIDLLNMKFNLNDVLHKNVSPDLDVLPAGRLESNASELLGGEKFKLLLEHLKKQYEYIIIDTAPIFVAVDATVISSYSDISVITCNFKETRKQELNECYNSLLQISYKKVFGIINRCTLNDKRIQYYGYGFGSVPGLENENHASPITRKAANESEIRDFLDKLKG